jgi:hypothetical protein
MGLITMKTKLLSTIMFLSMTTSALAGTSLNGWSNGISLNGWANGISLNGWQNGIQLNGFANNAITGNGIQLNGFGNNAITGNGIDRNGFGVYNASQTRPAIVLSGVRNGATTTDAQVHLTGIRLKKH